MLPIVQSIEYHLTEAELNNLSLLRLEWSVSTTLLALAAALMIPIYFKFAQRYHTLHPIIQSSVTLIIPDILLVANFLPLKAMSLQNDSFNEDYCIASAFTTIASIVASNAGVVFISWTTYASLVRQQRKINVMHLILVQVIGWALGVALASYYYSQDYLGLYLGLYCCTKSKHQLDIVIPVFLTFFFATFTMGYFYFKTFRHIQSIEQKASLLLTRKPSTVVAGSLIKKESLIELERTDRVAGDTGHFSLTTTPVLGPRPSPATGGPFSPASPNNRSSRLADRQNEEQVSMTPDGNLERKASESAFDLLPNRGTPPRHPPTSHKETEQKLLLVDEDKKDPNAQLPPQITRTAQLRQIVPVDGIVAIPSVLNFAKTKPEEEATTELMSSTVDDFSREIPDAMKVEKAAELPVDLAVAEQEQKMESTEVELIAPIPPEALSVDDAETPRDELASDPSAMAVASPSGATLVGSTDNNMVDSSPEPPVISPIVETELPGAVPQNDTAVRRNESSSVNNSPLHRAMNSKPPLPRTHSSASKASILQNTNITNSRNPSRPISRPPSVPPSPRNSSFAPGNRGRGEAVNGFANSQAAVATNVSVQTQAATNNVPVPSASRRSLSRSMFLRGLFLISIYYFCWFFVSFNSALSLAGIKPGLWPEMVAAWFIKLSPIFDALIIYQLLRKAEMNKTQASTIASMPSAM